MSEMGASAAAWRTDDELHVYSVQHGSWIFVRVQCLCFKTCLFLEFPSQNRKMCVDECKWLCEQHTWDERARPSDETITRLKDGNKRYQPLCLEPADIRVSRVIHLRGKQQQCGTV